MRQSIERDERAKIKTAIIRLNEFYDRMRNLAYKKMKSYGPNILSEGNVSEEDVERRAKEFSKTLTSFLNLKIRTYTTLARLGASLKSLMNATDGDGTSTLIGLTALADRVEYNRNAATLRKHHEEKLEPAMPEMAKMFKWISDLGDFGKWIDELINRDAAKKEDDFTEMIIAIRDRDIGRFNKIYEGLTKRIEIEERK